MIRPNLFILGAAKSGTTTLHNYLSLYQDICAANPKEPYFFEYEFEKGLDFYRKKYFDHFNGEKYILDSRHRNLFLPFVPSRIYKINKDARFIIILRDPVKRAYSHWWHYYSRGLEKKSFIKKIKEEILWFDQGIYESFFANPDEYAKLFRPEYGEATYTSYILSSIYSLQLKNYFDLFDKKQFFIIDFDDIVSDPEIIYRKLIDWIFEEENTGFISEFRFDNEAKMKDLNGFLGFVNKVMKPVKKLLPTQFIASAKNKLLMKPDLGEKESKILKDFYRPFNEELKKMIDFNVEKWEK